MEPKQLLSKLDLIEEQARLTLEEFSADLMKERQRMIISLARHLRWEIAKANPGAAADDPETTVRMPS